MEKEEILLGVEMGRLEIEPVKTINRNCENPFLSILQRRNIFKNPTHPKESKCTCDLIIQKYNRRRAIYKKKHRKILKKPILKILKDCGNSSVILEECQECSSKNISDIVKSDPLSLCTLVQNCNQLTISSSSSDKNKVVDVNNKNKWWKSEILSSTDSREPKAQSSRAGTCSQQALNPPCDVTIDELASYFETLVHIPKKMSSMAEMMYN